MVSVTLSRNKSKDWSAEESVNGKIYFRKNGIFVDDYQYAINAVQVGELVEEYCKQFLGSVLTKKIVNSVDEMTENSVIYLLKNDSDSEGNLYDEYLLVDDKLEMIGQTEHDHSDSLANEKIDEAFNEIFN